MKEKFELPRIVLNGEVYQMDTTQPAIKLLKKIGCHRQTTSRAPVEVFNRNCEIIAEIFNVAVDTVKSSMTLAATCATLINVTEFLTRLAIDNLPKLKQ